jgi:hypothetical protein
MIFPLERNSQSKLGACSLQASPPYAPALRMARGNVKIFLLGLAGLSSSLPVEEPDAFSLGVQSEVARMIWKVFL